MLQGEVDSSLIVLSNSGILSDWLLGKLADSSVLVIEAITWILLVGQAVYLSLIARKHQLVANQILMPGAMYLLVMNLIPEFLPLSSILFANTFLMLALNQLLKTYRHSSAARLIFDVGIWVAVACLFHFSYGGFILLSLVGLGTLRAFKISEAITMWLGVLCIAFLLFAHAFWYDQLAIIWSEQVLNNVSWLDFQMNNDLVTYISLSLVGIIVAIVIFGYSGIVQRQNIQFQKKVNVLYWTLLIGGIAILFNVDNTVIQAAIIGIPAGVLLGLLLSNISKTTAEVIHLLLFIAVVAWHYHPYWLK
ncbi:MAG: hypothetical protein AAGI23_16260 [Bacteroidota bacterium]